MENTQASTCWVTLALDSASSPSKYLQMGDPFTLSFRITPVRSPIE